MFSNYWFAYQGDLPSWYGSKHYRRGMWAGRDYSDVIYWISETLGMDGVE